MLLKTLLKDATTYVKLPVNTENKVSHIPLCYTTTMATCEYSTKYSTSLCAQEAM